MKKQRDKQSDCQQNCTSPANSFFPSYHEQAGYGKENQRQAEKISKISQELFWFIIMKEVQFPEYFSGALEFKGRCWELFKTIDTFIECIMNLKNIM